MRIHAATKLTRATATRRRLFPTAPPAVRVFPEPTTEFCSNRGVPVCRGLIPFFFFSFPPTNMNQLSSFFMCGLSRKEERSNIAIVRM